MTDEIAKYVNDYDEIQEGGRQRAHPRPRSLISRGSRPVRINEFDKVTGEWRSRIKMVRFKFNEVEKEIFLLEYAQWGRIGESAAAAGVSLQTVRKALDDDEDFAEAFLIQEQEYRDKLVGHHQDLLFNGTEKKSYDRNGNIVSSETIYPIRLIELELKKHDAGYRDKQELAVKHSGGVLVVPAGIESVEDWEEKFKTMKVINPPTEGED